MNENPTSQPTPDDDVTMLSAMVPPPGVERSRVFAALLRAITEDGSKPGRGGRR